MNTFKEYREKATRTRNGDLSERDAVTNAAMGLSDEAGEVLGRLKKELFHGNPFDPDAMKLELGDVLFYLDWAANCYGLTLEEVAQANIEKLQRRYPNKFSIEASRNRAE